MTAQELQVRFAYNRWANQRHERKRRPVNSRFQRRAPSVNQWPQRQRRRPGPPKGAALPGPPGPIRQEADRRRAVIPRRQRRCSRRCQQRRWALNGRA